MAFEDISAHKLLINKKIWFDFYFLWNWLQNVVRIRLFKFNYLTYNYSPLMKLYHCGHAIVLCSRNDRCAEYFLNDATTLMQVAF